MCKFDAVIELNPLYDRRPINIHTFCPNISSGVAFPHSIAQLSTFGVAVVSFLFSSTFAVIESLSGTTDNVAVLFPSVVWFVIVSFVIFGALESILSVGGYEWRDEGTPLVRLPRCMNLIFRVAPDNCAVCVDGVSFVSFDFGSSSSLSPTVRVRFVPVFAVAAPLTDDIFECARLAAYFNNVKVRNASSESEF